MLESSGIICDYSIKWNKKEKKACFCKVVQAILLYLRFKEFCNM